MFVCFPKPQVRTNACHGPFQSRHTPKHTRHIPWKPHTAPLISLHLSYERRCTYTAIAIAIWVFDFDPGCRSHKSNKTKRLIGIDQFRSHCTAIQGEGYGNVKKKKRPAVEPKLKIVMAMVILTCVNEEKKMARSSVGRCGYDHDQVMV